MYIEDNFPDLVEQMFIVDGESRDFGYFHRLTFIKAKDGKWYALSPANYMREETELSYKRMTSVFKANSLNGLLELCREYEGGRWPSEEVIIRNYEILKQTIEDKQSETNNIPPLYHYIPIISHSPEMTKIYDVTPETDELLSEYALS